MPLIKNRRLAHDAWQLEPQSGPLPDSDDLIVSLATWREHATTLVAREGRLGLVLESDEAIEGARDALPHVELVALHFKTFRDGRGFTQANLLRRVYGFRGELRATGELLPDQLRELERCGFDSVDIADADHVDTALANYDEIDVMLQPADDGELVFRRRFAVTGNQ
jgi:uncharacterized protein (DUF934 family)